MHACSLPRVCVCSNLALIPEAHLAEAASLGLGQAELLSRLDVQWAKADRVRQYLARALSLFLSLSLSLSVTHTHARVCVCLCVCCDVTPSPPPLPPHVSLMFNIH